MHATYATYSHTCITWRLLQRGGNWYDWLQGFERVLSHKGMLLTWLAGEEADIMEELPEQEVKDVLYELMVQFTNNAKLPRPQQIIRLQRRERGCVERERERGVGER